MSNNKKIKAEHNKVMNSINKRDSELSTAIKSIIIVLLVIGAIYLLTKEENKTKITYKKKKEKKKKKVNDSERKQNSVIRYNEEPKFNWKL